MFKYTCFVYGLLSLLSIGLNSSSKNNFLRKFCFWYGKCHNSIIILQLFLLKNQINSDNFKYCKERREDDSAENWQTNNQSKAWICKDKFLHRWKRKIVLDYYNHFGKFLLTFTLYDLRFTNAYVYINNLILVFLYIKIKNKSEKVEYLYYYI